MNGQAWVRVVIVNYNAGPWLGRVIQALAAQSDDAFEAVIVDNDSTDGSADAAALRLPDERFRLWRAGKNLGFAAGCNLGAAGATVPWLAMLNPDALPHPDWLAALRAAAIAHPEAALFGSTQWDAAEPGILLDGCGDAYSIFGLAWRGGHGSRQPPPGEDFPIFSPCAAAALYRRDLFEQLGGFAEGFFCYLEDVDLGFRFRLAGHRAVQLAAAQVDHVGSASAGRRSPFSLYHSARNGVWLMIRCLPGPLLLLSTPLYALAQLWLAMRAENGGARLKGLRDGLLGGHQAWRQRQTIQSRRRLSLGEVGRLLIWNPRRLSQRAVIRLPDPNPPRAPDATA
ncbi:MAG: glycosyltransferase family 2 protein [Magnetococcales bacterium]|nr:glycosyltransferase family 2 protein [Magnetococcales bacterium]